MSEIRPQTSGEQPATPKTTGSSGANGRPPQQRRGPSIHQIYALPTPIRTFPLPTFYPNNPVSLLHIAYAWFRQSIHPPPAEPAVIHDGVWSEATTSVHIVDEKSMRALWEQGFYGKGSLSRSEPNWLRREQVRRGLHEGHVSEIVTLQRREERAQAKWERARLEQEVIRQTRLDEARLAEARRRTREAVKTPSTSHTAAPVGPLELLALPNSNDELYTANHLHLNEIPGPFEDAQDDLLSNLVSAQSTASLDESVFTNGGVPIPSPMSSAELADGTTSEDALADKIAQGAALPVTSSDTPDLKRQKSVRFSPKVESTTFQLSDPPSPNHLVPSIGDGQQGAANGIAKPDAQDSISLGPSQQAVAGIDPEDIMNKEHLQLTPEEVFFLTFGLGALAVTDPMSGQKLSHKDLFTLFRQHSYFPPRDGPDDPDLQPDDDFLVHYAVYHHFRSLGWVPRAGIKFGVDWLLYTRGPVFDHAEFGLMVIPSYSDPWWKASGRGGSPKTWQWMHSIVRVLSHVMKSLVLVYVDIPPPQRLNDALETGVTEALKLYKVREVTVKRWSSNRNR